MNEKHVIERAHSANEYLYLTQGLLMAQAICARQIPKGSANPLVEAMKEISQQIDEIQQKSEAEAKGR
jgi:hypothetical protein